MYITRGLAILLLINLDLETDLLFDKILVPVDERKNFSEEFKLIQPSTKYIFDIKLKANYMWTTKVDGFVIPRKSFSNEVTAICYSRPAKIIGTELLQFTFSLQFTLVICT